MSAGRDAHSGPVIDCDVHCPVPTPEELEPFLSRHWNDYLREVGYRQLIGVNYTYPPWSDALSPTRGQSPQALAGDVFSQADLAILNVYYGLESQQHPYLVEALATAVNRWLEDRWLGGDDRLAGSVSVPPQHPDIAAAEIRRAASSGRFAAVLLPARAWAPYGSRQYWPIWDAAVDTGLTPAITYGGSIGTPSTPNGWVRSVFEDYSGFQQVFAAHITSLIANGVFDRFPDLNVVILESGWTWLPTLAWRMDAEWKAVRRELPWVTEPPSEYIRRHVRLTTQPIDATADVRALQLAFDHLGDDGMLVFGSDYPRAYEPDINLLLSTLDERQAQRVMSDNAVATYAWLSRQPVAAIPGAALG
jgi:uncharacterized protein